MALAGEIPSEGIYLKNWCLNYFENVGAGGFTPGLLTPKGVDRRLKHIKPFLAQGAYFASTFLKDFRWIKPHWMKLKHSVLYREKTYFDHKKNLGCWYDSMESGADNNVALLNYPKGSVLATDLNTFLYREYLAMSQIAKHLNFKPETRWFQNKARAIKNAMLKYLWDKQDGIFYNVEKHSGKFIKRVSYSSIVPLWGEIAPQNWGKRMLKNYVLNPSKLKARYGIRTLAKDDPEYNQKNIIKPYSNWQGPVWPIANYLTMHALLNYGFKKEARWLAQTITKICLADLEKTGGMHENYNADTGKPLAAPNFVSWNLLVGQMLPETQTNYNPFRLT